MDQPFPLATACFKCWRRVQERNCIVHGYGDANAKVMFVGEVPESLGANQTGVPWTRTIAGQRLQVLLRALRLRTASDPEHEEPRLVGAYLTYLVRCSTHADSPPTMVETSNCVAYLWRELVLVNPRIIVTVGEAPTRLMCAKLFGHVPGNVESMHAQPLPVDQRILLPMIDLETITKEEAHVFARVLSALLEE
ncbi:MAG TPA: hypothetical protein DEF47_07685 [Herpetosiphon sp.]|uniref:Uracil-DNA glycosylase superfamily n=1 Tax=Herpetosiphon aurantiacus (strain ATCC 23779 / DSM 785 / 114-95) TaxID=316274 RepID=A9B753_HERA2|nr:uracil-DNA glycosylase family protein [Herpetosiphon sp.]ABX06336.1 uracil-DNA glycosylase superfamily [Herpetosiphon aurantiacus DSM 785]HBW49772.1 hypothetical protein [Herpetosiphon sp.]